MEEIKNHPCLHEKKQRMVQGTWRQQKSMELSFRKVGFHAKRYIQMFPLINSQCIKKVKATSGKLLFIFISRYCMF